MRNFLYTVAALVLLAACAPLGLAADGPQKPDPKLAALLEDAAKLKCLPLGWVKSVSGRDRFDVLMAKAAGVEQDEKEYLCLNVAFDSAQSCRDFDVPGTYVLARFDKYLDVFVPADDEKVVDDFFAARGLVWLEIARSSVLPPPARPAMSEEKSRAIPDKILSGGGFGLTGKGVIVAVIDSGIDFNHPDFITYDQSDRPTSRILYYWDTLSDAYANGDVGSPAPIKYPNGAPIGTIYNQDELTDELRRSRPRILEWDSNGHGTGCAGIAAGNGNASKKKYQGVAPQADIIAVRVGGRGSSPVLENTYLLNAIAGWLDEIAGKRPLVLSCSFGGHEGPHDGSRIEELHFSARFPAERKGRVACMAAGNEGHVPMHAELKFGNRPAKLAWGSDGEAAMTIFVETPDSEDIVIEADESIFKARAKPTVNPLTKRTVVETVVHPGAGRLLVRSRSGKDYVAHAYLLGEGAAEFLDNSSTPARMVNTPATAAAAIAVGSYNWNDQFNQHGETYLLPDVVRPSKAMLIGELSGYSNPGHLTDDGAAKPEIVAPGQWFTAPAALNASAQRDTSGFYQLFNGTSAATPYTAGVMALLLEKSPSLSAGDIRRLLKQSAAKDQYTGSPPNPEWGYGKLNLTAIERMVKSAGR
jgi:subtilisin family serine protease